MKENAQFYWCFERVSLIGYTEPLLPDHTKLFKDNNKGLKKNFKAASTLAFFYYLCFSLYLLCFSLYLVCFSPRRLPRLQTKRQTIPNTRRSIPSSTRDDHPLESNSEGWSQLATEL